MESLFDTDLFTLREPSKVEKSFCYACCDLICGQAYFYKLNGFHYWLHQEPCFKLPPHIEHPLHPQHPLTLHVYDSRGLFKSRGRSDPELSDSRVSDPVCDSCGYYSPFTFTCDEGCRVSLCVKCAFDHQASLEEMMNDNRKVSSDMYFFYITRGHQHDFIACKSRQPHNFSCSSCMRSTHEYIYICIKCRFYVHKSCVESLQKLPRNVRHPDHSLHPLKPFFADNVFICDECKDLCRGIRFSCSKSSCRFNVDTKCGSLLEDYFSELDPTLEKRHTEVSIDHFCHPAHILKHCNINRPDNIELRIDCCYCNKKIMGSIYVCLDCNFFIHEACIDVMEEQVEHQYHSQHTLAAHVIGKDFEGKCNACKGDMAGVILRCDQCNFNLHYPCAKRNHKRSLADYKCHEHNLFYFTHDELSCTVLRNCCSHQEDLKSSCYRCVECDVDFHLECMPLLQIDKVRCNGDHPLKLVASTNGYNFEEYYCDVCEEIGTTNHHLYYCEDCHYLAHIECIVTKLNEEYEKASRDIGIIHFSHRQHALKLCYLSDRIKYNCQYCHKKIYGLHHVCLDCKFFIHESCRDQMKEKEGVQCLYHPQHPLFAFSNYLEHGRICNACRRQIVDIGVWCEDLDCRFYLHYECSIKPILSPLKLQFHNHSLFYSRLDELSIEIGCCDICHSEILNSSIYHCVECDSNTRFHLKCILDRLPLVETLVLSDSVAENDSEEYFCGICKGNGNTMDPHYHSEDWTYFAHIECAIMEDDISWTSFGSKDKVLRHSDIEGMGHGVHMAIIKYEGNSILENLRSEDKAKNHNNKDENSAKCEEADDEEDAKESRFEQLRQTWMKEGTSKVEIDARQESDTNQESQSSPFEQDAEVTNFCVEMDALKIKLKAIKGRQASKLQSIISSCREKFMELRIHLEKTN